MVDRDVNGRDPKMHHWRIPFYEFGRQFANQVFCIYLKAECAKALLVPQSCNDSAGNALIHAAKSAGRPRGTPTLRSMVNLSKNP
jgi:hypothetical protein